jgi:UDP-N-acetylmuramyl pentapeptide phosphotransferase/UDP-N-acetylglucosamine-1-phosphate transferase
MTLAAIIDTPSERSSHTVPTPRGGGVAVVAAAFVGLMFYPMTRIIAMSLVLFAAIGLVEDLRGLSIRVRLVLQGLAGIATGLALAQPAPTAAGTALVLGMAVWLVAYANAFNFMDGINGISAAHAVLGGITFTVLGILYSLPVLVTAGAVVAAAALTFFPWNAGRAYIFLGDVGSYGLGGMLGVLAIYGLLAGIPVEAVLGPFALYIADTGWTLARRAYAGEAWYRPHRTHAYQQLTNAGLSHQRVTAVTVAFGFAVSGAMIAASQSEPLMRTLLNALALAGLVAYLCLPSRLAKPPAFLRAKPSSDA